MLRSTSPAAPWLRQNPALLLQLPGDRTGPLGAPGATGPIGSRLCIDKNRRPDRPHPGRPRATAGLNKRYAFRIFRDSHRGCFKALGIPKKRVPRALDGDAEEQRSGSGTARPKIIRSTIACWNCALRDSLRELQAFCPFRPWPCHVGARRRQFYKSLTVPPL